MPLLFLITYIVISYFIYKKNKNKVDNIPMILQTSWILAFALLFVFIIYYSEVNLSGSEEMLYVYSFYFLVIWYFITYLINFFNYRKIYKANIILDEGTNNIWILETIINKSYFIIIFWLSIIYFISENPIDLEWWDWILILTFLFFIFSSLFILFKNKLLS